MQIWHILETEDEVMFMMYGKKAEPVGIFTNPQTFQPMSLYLVDHNVDGEINKVKMAVPLTIVDKNFDATRENK
jgi:hypothetical protein